MQTPLPRTTLLLLPCVILFLGNAVNTVVGQGSAGSAGLEIEEPDNEADWPKDDQWLLAIDIKASNHCPLRRGWVCEAHTDDKTLAVSNTTIPEMIRSCEAFCGSEKSAGDFREGGGHACTQHLLSCCHTMPHTHLFP